FLYKTAPTRSEFYFRAFIWGESTYYVGVRLDDGTDNNYVECVIYHDTSNRIPYVQLRWRTAGGTVNTYTSPNQSGWWLTTWGVSTQLNTRGTLWSSWIPVPMVATPYGVVCEATTGFPTGLTWKPTRAGIVIQSSGSSWEKYGVDWVNF
ncbi:MAG: hypothetical protein ACPLPV_00165, partial [Methanomassiliicoccales archaeon]